jgi:hypothetical protein
MGWKSSYFIHQSLYSLLNMQKTQKSTTYPSPKPSEKKKHASSDTTQDKSHHLAFWGNILLKLMTEYHESTPSLIKIIDVYILCSGSTFPFNAMLAGWISTIGSFVFAGRKIELNC